MIFIVAQPLFSVLFSWRECRTQQHDIVAILWEL